MSEQHATDGAIEADDPELVEALDSFLGWVAETSKSGMHYELPSLPSDPGIEPGTVLGDFELVRRLGMGGMSVVFEARQRSMLGRRVAVKVVRNVLGARDLTERFRREVTTIADLDHPGIVPIVAADVEAGTPYYAMKFVEGVSAADLVGELKGRADSPRTTAEVRAFLEHAVSRGPNTDAEHGSDSVWEESYLRWIARLGLQLAEALQYAHEHGVVHRDVKPGNVMITARGGPVLVDFGLASTDDDASLTRTGEFLGTLAYASPEQARGEPVDTRADVYSLGATLYELVALRRPFDARNRRELRRRIEEDDPPSLGSGVPADLRTILWCALSRSPGKRYQAPGAMARDLRAFLSGSPIEARPPSRFARMLHMVRRYPRLATGVAAVAMVLAGSRTWDHVEARATVRRGLRQFEESLAEQERQAAAISEFTRLGLLRPPPTTSIADLDVLRDEMDARRSRIETTYREAETKLRAAFRFVSDHGPARRGLARLYAARLALALAEFDDVLRPQELERWERELQVFDDGEYAPLLEDGGWVSLRCAQPNAAVEITRNDSTESAPRYDGDLPLVRLPLQEGSYTARVRAAGHAAAALPFLVRRTACYDAAGAGPNRELSISLLRPGDIPAGFDYIPGGETLVQDDPPRWDFVASFLMQRFEVTNGDLAGWYTPSQRKLLGAISTMEGEGEYPERPARGMKIDSLGPIARGLTQVLTPHPPDWYCDLPTVAEWMRAARGADGRRFPWGDRFERGNSANYMASEHFGKDPTPAEVGRNEGDVSPFGTRDMAGSVAEVTRNAAYPIPGHRIVCGGSYRSYRRDQLAVTFRREYAYSEQNPEIGFRTAWRPLPPWFLSGDEPPAVFADDFDRPDGAAVGAGWLEFKGVPFAEETNPHEGEDCFLEGGKLVGRGGMGDHSESSLAVHRIHVDERGYTVHAVIQGSAAIGPCKHSFGVRVLESLFPGQVRSLELSIGLDGGRTINFSDQRDSPLLQTDAHEAPTGPYHFELRVRGRQAEGRVWRVGEDRPADTELVTTLPVPDFLPRYVGFNAATYVGIRIEVDDVRVEPGP